LNLQGQGLLQAVQALQEAQERVLELAQEQVRVLGLAVAQLQELAQVEVVAQVLQERAQVLAQLALVEAEEKVEVLEPQGWVQLELELE
jgi:hypothetical protein